MCLICMQLKDMQGELFDLEQEMKEVMAENHKNDPADPTRFTMQELEDFMNDVFPDDGTDYGFTIIDQPSTGVRGERVDEQMRGCVHEKGKTSLQGTGRAHWYICKKCGAEMEKVVK